MEYCSKIHLVVKKPEDWEKLRDDETDILSELIEFTYDDFDTAQESIIIDSDWFYDHDELWGLIMEITERLEDSCLIFACSTCLSVDPYTYLVYYLGGDRVVERFFEEESTPEYGMMWDFTTYANIRSIPDCLNYCIQNHMSFTKEDISYLKAFGIEAYCDDDGSVKFREKTLDLDVSRSIPLTDTQYEGRIARIENVKVGDLVTLVREPENEFDFNTIDVRSKEGSLGYLDADASEILAPILDDGKTAYSAYIYSVTPLSKRSKRCRTALVEICVDFPSPY